MSPDTLLPQGCCILGISVPRMGAVFTAAWASFGPPPPKVGRERLKVVCGEPAVIATWGIWL